MIPTQKDERIENTELDKSDFEGILETNARQLGLSGDYRDILRAETGESYDLKGVDELLGPSKISSVCYALYKKPGFLFASCWELQSIIVMKVTKKTVKKRTTLTIQSQKSASPSHFFTPMFISLGFKG
jgi:hypothetical protein